MRHTIDDLAARADWVLPGLEEGHLPMEEHSPESIAPFWLLSCASLVAVKLGDQSAYYNSETSSSGHVPIVPAAEVVDVIEARWLLRWHHQCSH